MSPIVAEAPGWDSTELRARVIGRTAEEWPEVYMKAVRRPQRLPWAPDWPSNGFTPTLRLDLAARDSAEMLGC